MNNKNKLNNWKLIFKNNNNPQNKQDKRFQISKLMKKIKFLN